MVRLKVNLGGYFSWSFIITKVDNLQIIVMYFKLSFVMTYVSNLYTKIVGYILNYIS